MDEALCDNCRQPINAAQRLCPSCSFDCGYPNVREANAPDEREALEARYNAESEKVNECGASDTLGKFSKKVEEESCVVVNTPLSTALQFVVSKSSIYMNYEALVGSGSRTPAIPENDRERISLSGRIFGSYSKEIRYGALSLNGLGVESYGEVHFQLRDECIKHRTSFMECNSYKFYERFSNGVEVNFGHRSIWNNRHQLAIAKVGVVDLCGQPESNWHNLLLHSDGKDRNLDEFIEAHIFGGFNSNAFKDIKIPSAGLNRDDSLLAKLIEERFRTHSA